nr:hypothetical protein CFP56_53446 [Quercus suber]
MLPVPRRLASQMPRETINELRKALNRIREENNRIKIRLNRYRTQVEIRESVEGGWYGREEALRVTGDHRVERWTRSRESPTPATVRHNIPSCQNLSPTCSYLKNEGCSESGALQKNAYLCIDVCVDDMTGQGSTV